jgi:patatin-like phospholipase/acyl hydrolase
MAQFRILSLDGGGIRGAFTAGFLAEIERQTGRPIIDHFDLLAGTSTGAIIAVALAIGESAKSVEAFYRDRGAKIFTRPTPVKIPWSKKLLLSLAEWGAARFTANGETPIDRDWIFQPKYRTDELRTALSDVFQNRTLENAKRRLVVPAVNLIKGQTVVFKTPHAPNYVRDRHFRAVDVILATTAAPTYFPPAVINTGSAYADGGLWANNPAICAYAEAVCISQKCKRADIDPVFCLDDIHMLSVGTGRSPYFLSPAAGKEGALHWGFKLFDIMGSSQSQGINFQAAYLLGDQRHKRVDFDLPDKWPLDAVEHIERLIHLGHEKAIEELASVKQRFVGATAIDYHPFTN